MKFSKGGRRAGCVCWDAKASLPLQEREAKDHIADTAFKDSLAEVIRGGSAEMKPIQGLGKGQTGLGWLLYMSPRAALR
eukprot:1159470-Pelagomonas_calceolata.AAC.6